MASSTQWKLRRLAARVLRVVARRSERYPTIAVFGETIVPKATAYMAAYDAYAKFAAAWMKEMGEGKGAVAAVLTLLKAWLPLATRDVPGFDGAAYGDSPAVPDDVLEDCERFLDVLEEAKTAEGAPLAWAPKATAELEPLVQAAAKEWGEAEAADARFQELGGKARETAARFDAELQLFRKTVLAALGSRDRDYQRLRAKRAAVVDEDDDAAAPAGPAPVPVPADA